MRMMFHPSFKAPLKTPKRNELIENHKQIWSYEIETKGDAANNHISVAR